VINRLLKPFSLIRIAALIALFGTATSFVPEPAAAAKFEDGYYESARFGFSVEYDDQQWVAKELEGDDGNEGIGLENELTWSNIRGVEREDMDEEACLEYMAEGFNDGETMRGFRRAPRSVEVPETGLGGEAALYSMEMGKEESAELYMYLQCVSIADDTAALMIMMTTPIAAYEDALPTWNDLLAGIEIGEATADEDAAPDDENATGDAAGSGEYVADELGLTISWDDAVWDGTKFDDESGYGMEFENELSYAYISPTDRGDATPQECVEILASNLEESDAFKRVRKAPGEFEPIEGDAAGYGELYTMLSTDSPDKLAMYAECRPTADDDQLLVIYISAAAGDYEAEHESWQELIDGIRISDDAGSSDRDDDAAETGEFTGENYDYSFSYDTDLWEVEVSTEEGYDWVGMTAEYASVVVLATESDLDLDGCIDSLLEDEQQYAEGDIEPAPRSYDLPESSRDAEGALYTYEANEEGGSGEVLVYFDCRYIEEGESILAVTFLTSPELYEDAMPMIEAILETTEIG
jgi:hypothetical protein